MNVQCAIVDFLYVTSILQALLSLKGLKNNVAGSEWKEGEQQRRGVAGGIIVVLLIFSLGRLFFIKKKEMNIPQQNTFGLNSGLVEQPRALPV